ncbi:sigma-54-dependent transcriptional regulator [Daejeonella lutea]|uniref:DNA-binding transcriptional response regulator, NtrC family, contains REC, AAA-type ATPase, and a Fis-type DNA-binding domains n=1 Tax=Daejeonella lutea TaxID=572036 RepID=A0A1T5BQR6_9SPHI|nr:sigma-54 dependent transcriptional regulator [Daejeonella lutea]SKB49505.1 DNA-binding transcriptional response regulator, NtrC family, contains REC, AAA-type ATPase, and a Fis-type DNA-binding domains [Daejeonella lutea]
MILIIDDDIAIRTSLSLLLKQEGFEITSAEGPEEGYARLKERAIELVLLDMNFSLETSGLEGLQALKTIKKLKPEIPVILMTGWGSITLAVEGMKNGAADFVHKPWDNANIMQVIRTALELSDKNRLQTENSYNRKQLNDKYGLENIISEDARMLSILKTVGRISSTDASVLITGESGTGKELIAEAIHQNSNRRNKPFIKVNLGGISSSLFESEMFGHKRGSFTDAKNDRLGRFEMAHKGTIFLDEIGDLDLNSQVKLLRVLQDRTYEVLGDSRTKTVDVRVVCATNRNLQEMVAENKFREDLYYRINLITVNLPPLRERSNDIPLLINYFLDNLKTIYGRDELNISREAINWLKSRSLPGNIRELKNLVERTVLVSETDMLEIKDFEKQTEHRKIQNSKFTLPEVGSVTIDEMELSMIQKAMEFHRGNISKVARSLGLSRGTLYRKLEKYNIPYEAQK